MRAVRHIVMGARGTVLAAPSAIALIDAPPTANETRAWEDWLFERHASGATIDSIEATTLPSFGLVTAHEAGTTITVHGDISVEIDGKVWLPAPGEASPSTREVSDDATITLSLEETGSPTGQWVTTGVIAAGSVAVGELQVPHATVPMQRTIDAPTEPDHDDAGFSFGSLIGDMDDSSVVEQLDPASAATTDVHPAVPLTAVAKSDATAQFRTTSDLDASGAVRTSEGQLLTVATPIVFGRRPPDGDVAGQVPQLVVINDTLVSRHHATMLIADGRLVVVDEGSANGTTVSAPGAPTVRCAQGMPVEVPPGATVDIAGVLTAIHETGTTPC